MNEVASAVSRIFREKGVALTIGAEPTCVPLKPRGAEWTFAATGPTKLDYAFKLAGALVRQTLKGGVVICVPGKLYPGEVNPRWALHVVARRDGAPIVPPRRVARSANARLAAGFMARLARELGLRAPAQKLRDSGRAGAAAWVLPLDHDGRKWSSPAWRWPRGARLIRAEGPAGLRLPWDAGKGRGPKRALTLEIKNGRFELFLPPVLQGAWSQLLAASHAALPAGVGCRFSGYVPPDEAGQWREVVIASDPGVLEINLPPCRTWQEYDEWLNVLDRAQKTVGLQTCKDSGDAHPAGTGGGHHLLFGGATIGENPFFTRPGWLASIARFWQHHPSLAYLFTGTYVGSFSQAPRLDESGKNLQDLEMAYAWLEQLPPGRNHRQRIADALTHLHSDVSGNTHRTEISFDKFWNMRFDGGTRGLVEFRALESLPQAGWSSSVALLWLALVAHLLARPFRLALKDFGATLHDLYFLPSGLWEDFSEVLAELSAGGFEMDEAVFRTIWGWRFPVMLELPEGLVVRRALEDWPLLCETPLEGGATSRFVDTSMERIEFAATGKFARDHILRVNGRELPLHAWRNGSRLAGLRYRCSALHPSLHPGIPVQLPLVLEVAGARSKRMFILAKGARKFAPAAGRPPARGEPCRRLTPAHFCHDLRLD